MYVRGDYPTTQKNKFKIFSIFQKEGVRERERERERKREREGGGKN